MEIDEFCYETLPCIHRVTIDGSDEGEWNAYNIVRYHWDRSLPVPEHFAREAADLEDRDLVKRLRYLASPTIGDAVEWYSRPRRWKRSWLFNYTEEILAYFRSRAIWKRVCKQVRDRRRCR